MIDLVVKLIWNYKILRAFFVVNDADYETRKAHPEFFMTMHDSLICAFCVGLTVLFDDKEKATSLWSLIEKSKPAVAKELGDKIRLNQNNIQKIEAIRHQVFAHRWQKKSPRDVFAEVQLQVGIMGEIADLSKFAVYKLSEEIDPTRKADLEKQQLNQSTLQAIADEVAQLMRTFPKISRIS